MALLGHTFGDTHESYEHVELPMKRDAIRKLDAWREAEAANTGKEGDGSTATPATQGSIAASGGAPVEGPPIHKPNENSL